VAKTVSTSQGRSNARKVIGPDKNWIMQRAKRLAHDYYPELKADVSKIAEIVEEARRDSKHYAKVIGPEGEPRAVLIAITAPLYWAQRNASHIVFWYSERPGEGWKLLTDYKSWVVANSRTIRVAGLQMDVGIGRASHLLRLGGFELRGGAHLIYTKNERSPLMQQAKEVANGFSK
jgi:hypothetical protein